MREGGEGEGGGEGRDSNKPENQEADPNTGLAIINTAQPDEE